MSLFSHQVTRRPSLGLPLMVGAIALNALSAVATAQDTESALKPLAPGVYEAGTQQADPLSRPAEVAAPLSNTDLGEPAVASKSTTEEVIVEEEVAEKRWRLTPIIGIGATYDDNIYITPDHKTGDLIFSLAGGLAFDYGDYREKSESYLSAQYIGTGVFYADNSSNNGYNEDALLAAQYQQNKLTLGSTINYLHTTGSDRDVGDLAERYLLNSSVYATYDYSEKTSLNAEFQQSTSIYENYNSSYDYTLILGADYWVRPKIALGLEGRFGYLTAENNADQTYEQIRLRTRYQATGKVELGASAGVELRQYDGGRGNTANSVFSLSSIWQARENTAVSLEAYRRTVTAALYEDQNQTITGVVAGVSQKLFQCVDLQVNLGYENADYWATRDSVDADREDNYIFIRPSVAVAVHRWVDLGVFYEYRRNYSDHHRDRFSNNRVGLELTSRF